MTPKPVLIIINGFRGSGKTTLARKLADDLQLPFIGKDDVKEFLADKLQIHDIVSSKLLGLASSDVLILLGQLFLENGRSLIVESPFRRQFAGPKFEHMVESGSMRVLELYCFAEASVRTDRYIARTKSGSRHPIHFDGDHHAELADDEISGRYGPLNVGKLMEVDTTDFGETEYQGLLTRIKSWMKQ